MCRPRAHSLWFSVSSCRATGAAGTYLWGGLCRIDVIDAPLTTTLSFFGSKALRVEAMPLQGGPSGGLQQIARLLTYQAKCVKVDSLTNDACRGSFDSLPKLALSGWICRHQAIGVQRAHEGGQSSIVILTINLSAPACAESSSNGSHSASEAASEARVQSQLSHADADEIAAMQQPSTRNEALDASSTGPGHDRDQQQAEDPYADFIRGRGGLRVAKEVTTGASFL